MTFPSASLGVESAMSLDATPCRLGSALVQNLWGAYANHVSESIDEIQLLQNIESMWSALPPPETYLLQDLYSGDGRWAAATKCMGNNTKERMSDIFSKRRDGDPRVVTGGQLFARDPEVRETTSSDAVRLADNLGKFLQGGEPGQDCRFRKFPYTHFR